MALKIKAAIAAAALAAGPVAVLVNEQGRSPATIDAPALVELASGTLHYWAPGEFTQNGKPANARRASPSRCAGLSPSCNTR